MSKNRWHIYYFGLLLVVEALSHTFGLRYGNKNFMAILYLLAGLGIGILPILQQGASVRLVQPTTIKVSFSARWLMFIMLALAMVFTGMQIMSAQALDYTFADMLPIIQIMGERWLAGEEVYAIIPEIWDGMQPIYLPILWLAYVPAIIADIDIRWVNIAALLLSTALALDLFNRRSWPVWQLMVLLPLLGILIYVFGVYSTFITISEEPIVLAAYMLLGYALWKDKIWWIGIAIVACLLSRYALIFWLICWWGYYWWQGNRRQAWRLAIGGGVLGILVMIASQGIYQLELFYSLKDAYLDSFTPDLAWRTQNTVAKNVGMARFVPFDYLLGMHRLLFWGSILLPVGLYAWYHFGTRHKIQVSLFALCSLKLCLVFFFNVNPLPYSYLFYTSTFLSLIVFNAYLNSVSTEAQG